jgi:recombinational DNA repair protein (RecF pathway)
MSRPAAYQIAKSAFICSQCSGKIAPQAMMELTDKQQELLNLIPVIGNHLAVLEIDKATAQELTNLLLNHLNFHYSNHFNLKSLKVLFQKI